MSRLVPIAWLLATLGPAVAQPPAPEGPRVVVTQPDESRFPEITVYFELKRPDGTFELGATRGDFRVAEDGVDRPILRFEAPEAIVPRPTTVALVVDRSGSMEQEGRLVGLKRAVATFLADLPAGSRVAVIALGDEVELICPFTADKDRARAAVDALDAGGGTRFYDAVAAAVGILADQPGRKAILALTDGQDTISRAADLGGAIAAARRANIPVHTLGLGNELEIALGPLRKLAEDTRGGHYLARDADQLRKIYEEIARRLGSTYALMYETDRKVPDGTLRPIRIAYAKAAAAGETAVFIRGMVVPQAGWSRLYLALIAGLGLLAMAPRWLRRHRRSA